MIWIVNDSNNYLYTFIVTAWFLENERYSYQGPTENRIASSWREIMDMIKYSSLRAPVICIHSNNVMHG